MKKTNNKFDVTANGNVVKTPLFYDGDYISIQITQSGGTLILKTSFGLTVKWDGNNKGDVSLCDSYANYVCGFCGNANGSFSYLFNLYSRLFLIFNILIKNIQGKKMTSL